MNSQLMDEAVQTDQSFKYVMLDVSNIYVGARFSYGELLNEDMVPFKLRAVVSHYLMKDVAADTTLESQLYYLGRENFVYETLRQLRVKVKTNVLVEKKPPLLRLGRRKKRGRQFVYKERILTLEELTGMTVREKEDLGLIVRELIVSRLGLMSFSV